MKTFISTLLLLLFLSSHSAMAQQNGIHAKIEKLLLDARAYNGFIELSPEYFQKGFVFGNPVL